LNQITKFCQLGNIANSLRSKLGKFVNLATLQANTLQRNKLNLSVWTDWKHSSNQNCRICQFDNIAYTLQTKLVKLVSLATLQLISEFEVEI